MARTRYCTWVLVAGMAAGVFAACDSGSPIPDDAPPPLEGAVRLSAAQIEAAAIVTTEAASEPLQMVARVPGTVGSPDTAESVVGSIVEGRVVRVAVVPGDQVRRGQALVEIHTHELYDAQAQLTAARAEADFHATALARAEKLYEAGAVSLEELQRRRVDHQAAAAERERAQEMVDHLYPTRTGNSAAVAPQSGVVFSVDVRQGEAVLPGTPLVRMGSTTVLWVTAYVPENTSAFLETGDSVTVGFRSGADSRTIGRLVRMGEFVDPGNRSVEMRFELASIPAGVRPGSFATVDIASDAGFTGLALPEDAAHRIAGDDVVFVDEGDGVFRALPVSVTALEPGRVAVQGVPEGAKVVVEGGYFLKSALEAAQASEEGDGS